MDPRLIMAAIEQNHKVMHGQLERLQAFTPAGMMNLSGELSVGELMASVVTAQLQGAVDAITAMTEAEATLRSSSMPGEHVSRIVAPADQPIEAEFKEIK